MSLPGPRLYHDFVPTTLLQQLIDVGLLDQIQISLIPLLLGEGLRLFERIGSEQRKLEKIKVIDSPGRTDIRYRVVK